MKQESIRRMLSFHPALIALDLLGLSGIAICLNELSPGNAPPGWVPQNLVWPLLSASVALVAVCMVYQVKSIAGKVSKPSSGNIKRENQTESTSLAHNGTPKWIKWTLIGCGALAAIFFASKIGTSTRLASSDPYKNAIALIEQNPEIIRTLGSPLTYQTPKGTIDTLPAGEVATLEFIAQGPMSRGRVHVGAVKTAKTLNRWEFTRLDIYEEKSRSVISVMQAARK